MIKKNIPNFITCCNLACGCVALVMAFDGKLSWSVYLIWAAMVFDFFDGLAARLLQVASPIGKELDSLADMVSFGVVPATIMYQLIGAASPWALAAYLLAIFSALRLAKFNIDENQQVDFIGLPTPANAIFISSLVFVVADPEMAYLLDTYTLVIITVIFSLLLVAPIRLFSLKIKSLAWRDNKIRIVFLLLSVAIMALWGLVGLPLVILLYIVLSVAADVMAKHNLKQ